MISETSDTSESGLTRFESGLPELDQILGGGLVTGGSYIIQGAPGTGKTILANQICFARAANGQKSLYMTLLSESFSQMFAFLQSLDFFDISKVPDYIYYASAYATLRQEGLDALLHLIVQEIRKRRPSVLVFEGIFAIGELSGAGGGETELRRFLNELAALAAQHGMTIVLVTNSDRRPSSPEYAVVDGWVELVDDAASHHPSRHLLVHKQRGGPILRGRHEYRISDAGLEVYPRMESLPRPRDLNEASTRRLGSGIPGLDRMTGGGIPEHSATAVMGPAGSGKTTVGLHFAASATPEAPSLFFGFYEKPARLLRKAAGIGLDLEAQVESGAAKMVWFPPAETLIDEIGRTAIREVETTGAKRVVFDGLVAACRPMADETRLRFFLRALNDRLLALGATVVYTYEVPQLFFPEVLGSGQFSGLVDNTLLLHYLLDGPVVRRRATLLKLRDGDFDHRGCAYRITRNGLVLEPIENDEVHPTTDAVPARPARTEGTG
ncbi:ATPase domain-containing protein [Jiella avicenniae]|uniref:AAA family ATPase n=1 Tax=Jiella avicenniae TaxID=2907202 RepID=A0A9X1T5B2_9HYPH|nr:ATPase domain-containing protein [Jiella avicenniae]MCE7027985.1 AAA family ATPase [Jiella avicenniae]